MIGLSRFTWRCLSPSLHFPRYHNRKLCIITFHHLQPPKIFHQKWSSLGFTILANKVPKKTTLRYRRIFIFSEEFVFFKNAILSSTILSLKLQLYNTLPILYSICKRRRYWLWGNFGANLFWRDPYWVKAACMVIENCHENEERHKSNTLF